MKISHIIEKLAHQCGASLALLECLADELGLTADTRGAEEALFLALCRTTGAIDDIRDILAEANWESPQCLVTPPGIAWHYGISRQDANYILQQSGVRPVGRTSHRQGRQGPVYRVSDIIPVFENWNAIRDPRGRKKAEK
jgi:hypothetical protein